MMKLRNNAIYLTRGDSANITVSLKNTNGTQYPLVTGDKVYFTVKTNINTIEKVFQKIITDFPDGIATINILPSDTKNLSFAQYVYDVQLTKADGSVTTIIEPTIFKIEGEVTYE